MGINKTICSEIAIEMVNNDINEITFITAPDGTIYPLSELPVIDRKLEGFLWFGDERIRTKDDIFGPEDLQIKLAKIRGLTQPIDRENLANTEEKTTKKQLSQQ
jgi:hypothetical protein